MAASEAAVTAVMETLGCEQSRRRRIISDPSQTGHFWCQTHELGSYERATWTDRGCPVAVAAADAAVDADRASIQAETLREAADVINAGRPCLCCPPFAGDEWPAAAMLHDRADRIEAQP